MDMPRVLVVDDDRGNSLIVSRILQDQGYVVDQAVDAKAALGLVDRHEYRLAVLDYLMPGMNGVELFEEIRRRRPDTLGIFLTAYATINTVFPAIQAGVSRVLAKPVDVAELLSLIEELVAQPR